MSGPGQIVIGAVQRGPQLIADGDNQFFKEGGITVAWDLVDALGGDVVFPGGIKAAAGEKWVRIGTPLVLIDGGTYDGLYAPLKDAAANGQGAITRGRVYLNNRTFSMDDEMSDYAPGGVLYGGLVWEKLIVVPAGFTIDDIYAALPMLQPVNVDPI